MEIGLRDGLILDLVQPRLYLKSLPQASTPFFFYKIYCKGVFFFFFSFSAPYFEEARKKVKYLVM